MSTPYQPGIPTGTVNLDIDYQNLQTNFTQLNNIFGIDHTPLAVAQNSGYHQSVHLVSQSTVASNPPNNYPPMPPPTVANIGQLFSASINDGYNTGTALFFLTGAGNIRQLTSNFTPQAAQNGYTFLPGGITFQWGYKALPNSGFIIGAVDFADANINFANNCFSVTTTLLSRPGGTNSSNNTLSVRSDLTTKQQFTFDFNGNAGSYTGFYWVAIGN